MGFLHTTEEASAPATPGTGIRSLYPKSDGWYDKDDAGVETKIGASLHGTTTNDDAATGDIGEYIESQIAAGSAVALTNATFANITSITLTPGDWDVVGNAAFQGQAGTTSYTRFLTGISVTSATGESPYQTTFYTPAVIPATAAAAFLPSAQRRIKVATGTTQVVYLLALANFTAGTASAYGFIGARRRR